MALGEFDLIARYFTWSSGRSDVHAGVGDDAALLEVPPGQLLVAATDTLVEGRHFLPDAPPETVGHQALAVNLSDLAAMGATPAWALLALSLPRPDAAWLEGFARGLKALAGRFEVSLVGGDTVRGPLVVTVQVLGFVPPGLALRRTTARPGDGIYVSGTLGDAAAGLEAQCSGTVVAAAAPLVERYLRAEPRVALGLELRGVASAAMDVSDGLLGDLARLCAASGVAADVELTSLPYSPAMLACRTATDAERLALGGGDDYELLFTVPSPGDSAFEAAARAGCRITRIGAVRAGHGVRCMRDGLAVVTKIRGHDHFAE